MKRGSGLIFVVILMTSLMTVQADPGAGPMLITQADGITQDEAAAKVRAATGGRVLDVRSQIENGVRIYSVKVLLPDGRIRVVTVGGS